MQKDPNSGYLIFTKKERVGAMVILCIVLLIFICAKYIYPFISKEEIGNSRDISASAAQLKEMQKDSTKNYYPNKEYGNDNEYKSYTKRSYDNLFTGEMFYFDPNTLDDEGWRKLGIREKTIATIRNYVSKGGKFRDPEDLRKIWGLKDNEKDRLIPYVRITSQSVQRYPGSDYSNNYKPYEKKVYEKKIAQPVEINSGDSAAFDGLPGIGPGFSRRIINFRNRLGGFYKIEQIGETFGLPDSVFQKIKPFLQISGNNIRKKNINTATNEELKAHPYIRWQLANVISEYRKQHGEFKNLSDLKKIMVINEETYNRILPYLTL